MHAGDKAREIVMGWWGQGEGEGGGGERNSEYYVQECLHTDIQLKTKSENITKAIKHDHQLTWSQTQMFTKTRIFLRIKLTSGLVPDTVEEYCCNIFFFSIIINHGSVFCPINI